MTKDKRGNLCKTCANPSCYNRKPYKTFCSDYKESKLNSKDIPSGYANSQGGERLRHLKEERQLGSKYKML